MMNYSWIVSVLVLTNQAGALAAQPAHDAHAVSTMRNDAAPMINVQGTAKLGTTGLLKRVTGRRLEGELGGAPVNNYPWWLSIFALLGVPGSIQGSVIILSVSALVKLLTWVQGRVKTKAGEALETALETVPIKNSKKLNNWLTRWLVNMFIWWGIDALTAPLLLGIPLSRWILIIKLLLVWGLFHFSLGVTSAIICHSYVVHAATTGAGGSTSEIVTASIGIALNLLISILSIAFLAIAGKSLWSVPIAILLILSVIVGKIFDLLSLGRIWWETVNEMYTWIATKLR